LGAGYGAHQRIKAVSALVSLLIWDCQPF